VGRVLLPGRRPLRHRLAFTAPGTVHRGHRPHRLRPRLRGARRDAPAPAARAVRDRRRPTQTAPHPRRDPRGPVPGAGRLHRPRARAEIMRSTRIIHTVDAHVEGLPVRVVTGGAPTVPGATMDERRRRFLDTSDALRTLLMCEPRGSGWISGPILQPPTRPDADGGVRPVARRPLLLCQPPGGGWMSGAILQPPTRLDADWGVLFIEVTGVLPMCGAGTIGVATVLVDTGMVPVTEPVTTVRLDAPIGLITVDVHVEGGKATSATIRNVPSYAHSLARTVHVPGYGALSCYLAFGGTFYAIVALEQLGIPFERAAADRLISAGTAIMTAVD